MQTRLIRRERHVNLEKRSWQKKNGSLEVFELHPKREREREREVVSMWKFIPLINQLEETRSYWRGERQRKLTYLPSSSFISYSSVKRVHVISELDTGVLFITAAILTLEAVGLGDTLLWSTGGLLSLVFELIRCCWLLLFVLWLIVLRNLLNKELLYFIKRIQSGPRPLTSSTDDMKLNRQKELDVGWSSWLVRRRRKYSDQHASVSDMRWENEEDRSCARRRCRRPRLSQEQ